MTQKPKIQYVGQFYIHGSEAQAVALKEKQKKAKTRLPLAKLEQITEIQVEPVAVVSIVLAVALLAAMVSGCLSLRAQWAQYQTMANYVDQLAAENVSLMEAYRASYDLDEVEARAQALGLVRVEQVAHRSITLTPPAPVVEETLWDEIVWFFQGLFA